MEDDPVEAIEKALAETGDLDNYEKLAELQLTQLQRDYEATLAANIESKEEEEEPEPGYDMCDSDSDDEDWGEMQSAPSEEPPRASTETQTQKELSSDQIKHIRETMSSLQLPAPAWAVNLSDDVFLRMVSDKLRA